MLLKQRTYYYIFRKCIFDISYQIYMIIYYDIDISVLKCDKFHFFLPVRLYLIRDFMLLIKTLSFSVLEYKATLKLS